MNQTLRSHWLFAVLLSALGIFHLLSAGLVPFHPDESTYLFMSSDTEAYFQNPLDLAWQADNAGDLRQRYRTLNAPLTRYAIGLGRMLISRPALPADWDWSATWQANVDAGVLPDPALLWFARLPSLLFLELSLLFIYLAGCRLHGRGAGLMAAFLLASNSLVMLHGRRAMTEGPLLLGITFFLWSLNYRQSKPWLVGLAVALALNAKHSGAALLPIGLLAVLWIEARQEHFLNSALRNTANFLLPILALTWALNPFLWRDPAAALAAAWQNRQVLLEGQVEAIRELAPGQILDTPVERLTAISANLYILPPSFSEIGNYATETADAESNYLAVAAHSLLRGLFGGGILLLLTLFGLITAVLCLRRKERRRKSLLLFSLATTAVQFAALLFAVPLPWQRFVLPLTPFVAVWAAFGLSELIRTSLLLMVRRLPEIQPASVEFG